MNQQANKLYKHEFSKKELRYLFHSSVKYHCLPGIDGINATHFENNLSEQILIIKRKVSEYSYTFSQYREELISKGANKLPRVISIPTIRDKLVLKALSKVLIGVFGEFFPPLHVTISEVLDTYKSGQYESLIRLDINNFYPSIRYKPLRNEITKKIKKQEILSLIFNAISQKTVSRPKKKNRIFNFIGVPQGLSISNILANIYLLSIDSKYKSMTSIKYYRYVDDIIIFCMKSDEDIIYKSLSTDLGILGLTLHGPEDPEKFQKSDIAASFNFLGYHFENNKTSIRDDSVNKFRTSIISYFTSYKYSKKKNPELLIFMLNLRISGCVFDSKKYGWVFYFSQITDHKILYSLDNFISEQIERFGLTAYQNQIKKIKRTYFEITKNFSNSTYIPKFDQYTLEQMKEIIEDVFKKKTDDTSDEKIRSTFRNIIFKSVKDLEKDLSKAS